MLSFCFKMYYWLERNAEQFRQVMNTDFARKVVFLSAVGHIGVTGCVSEIALLPWNHNTTLMQDHPHFKSTFYGKFHFCFRNTFSSFFRVVIKEGFQCIPG